MRLRVLTFVLAAGLAAYGQGRPASHPGGPPMGGPPGGSMGQGQGQAGAGSMGGMHPGAGSEMGNKGMTSQPSNRGKQSPDTILSRDTKLNSNLEKLLPSGTTAQQACAGFKNLGQCVAAIHVSHNLDIPFADLKAKTTGTGAENLGKAIHALKPDADAKAETKKAQKQANDDLKEPTS